MSYEERVSLEYLRFDNPVGPMAIEPQTDSFASGWKYSRFPDCIPYAAVVNDYNMNNGTPTVWPDPGVVVRLDLRRGLSGPTHRMAWFETAGGEAGQRWAHYHLFAYPETTDEDLTIRLGDYVQATVIRNWTGTTQSVQVDLIAQRTNAMLNATTFTGE